MDVCQSARGVATESQGRILITDNYNDLVLLPSLEGEMLMELLTEEDGMDMPSLIYVRGEKLVVSMNN